MAEHAGVAVLRVDGVREDPDALALRTLALGAGHHHAGQVAGAAVDALVDAGGVRPDGVGALGAAAGALAAAGVDDDEVVHVAVGLEELVAGDAVLVLAVVLGPGEVGVLRRRT